MRRWYGMIGAVVALALALSGRPSPAQSAGSLSEIDHIIVIYQENWSFDSLYGTFPGANGWANAANAPKQVDRQGRPYATLPPPPVDSAKVRPVADTRFPPNMPVQPFDLAKYVAPGQRTSDLVHRFYQEQLQIDGGKMDKFVAWSDAAGLVLSYYDATNMPEGRLAQQYTLGDNFFHAAFGGSFLNHFWLVCACTPRFPNAPASAMAQLDDDGGLVKDGFVTPDGYAVNTAYTVNTPHPSNVNPSLLVPEQTMPTIGDRLSEKNVSWAWYSGGWDDAVAGHPDPLFQFHHQVFAYFQNYADGTPGRAAHLKDEKDFLRALTSHQLPAVSFVKPLGTDNEHPGYTDLQRGQQHVADLVAAVQQSPYWADSAIIITYDENGGRYDHVAPPKGDRWGPGVRVPLIVISPFAKRGFVDHAQYDTTSILKTIEVRWGIKPLGARDGAATPLTNAFDFTDAPNGLPAGGEGGGASLRHAGDASATVILVAALVVISTREIVRRRRGR